MNVQSFPWSDNKPSKKDFWREIMPDFQIVNKWFSNNSSHNKKCFGYPQNVNFPLAESNNFLVNELEVYKVEFE